LKGPNQIILSNTSSWTVNNPAKWTKIEEYSFCVTTSQNLIDGKLNQLEYKTKTEDLDINAAQFAQNFKLTHCWDQNTFPHFETPDVVNVKNAAMMNGSPATGDNISDDTDELEYAIANYEKIFLPKGTYKITRPLVLKANTKIFGISRTYSAISGGNIETVDNPDATTQLAFLDVSGITWKAGRSSFVRDVNPSNITITGNGGGKWYALFNTGSRLTVSGTSQPLKLYASNPERASDPQYQILNSKNVQMYYVKSEAGGSISSVATSLKISNSSNIEVYGCTGNINLSTSTGKAIMDITDCNDILIAHVHQFVSSTSPWFIIKEKIGAGAEVGVAANSKLALYRRGSMPTALGDLKPSEKLQVYPNPFSDHLTICMKDYTPNCKYKISDIHGKMIQTGKIDSEKIALKLDLTPGMYIVSIFDREKVVHTKGVQQ
jgi:hypothetical protein